MAYFVMRFVQGDDLRTRVRRDGPLAPRPRRRSCRARRPRWTRSTPPAWCTATSSRPTSCWPPATTSTSPTSASRGMALARESTDRQRPLGRQPALRGAGADPRRARRRARRRLCARRRAGLHADRQGPVRPRQRRGDAVGARRRAAAAAHRAAPRVAEGVRRGGRPRDGQVARTTATPRPATSAVPRWPPRRAGARRAGAAPSPRAPPRRRARSLCRG